MLLAYSAVAQDAPDAAAEVKPAEGSEQDGRTRPEPGSAPALSEIVPPRLLHFEQAPYPGEAQKQGIEASVVLQIEVDAGGHVVAVDVREPALHGFDEAAVDAAKRFVFKPATRGGSPVGAKILYRYRFTLEAQPAPALQYAPQRASKMELDVTVRGVALHREVAHYELSRTELVRVPGTMGDSIRAIEAMPSVAKADDPASGDLVVRGSLAEDTNVFVDGTWVPRVFHLGGLASVVPSEMIETLGFYPSNFSVRYGRGTGGVVDVGLRLINPDGKYHGSAQVDFINARANVEGPIPLTDKWNLMAGVRASYLDLWLGPVLRDSESSLVDMPRYYDYQLYVERRLGENGVFRLGFFGAHDQDVPVYPKAKPDDRDTKLFWHLQPYLRLPLSSAVDLTVSGSLGRVREYKEDFYLGTNDQEVILAMLRAELSLKTGTFGIARIGTDMLYAPVSVEAFTDDRDANGQLASWSTGARRLENYDLHANYFRPAAFAEYELTPSTRVNVTAGTRIDYAKDTSQYDIAPRIAARYVLVDKPVSTVLKGGLGLFYQPPNYEYTLPELGYKGLRSIRAIHSILGVEQSLSKQVTLSVEGFEKEVQRIVYGRVDGSGSIVLDNSGHARMFGADVLLRYQPDDRFFGWIAYTISRTAYKAVPDKVTWRIHRDEPHVLNVVGSYRLGRGWEIGGRFQFVSGFLYSSCIEGMFDNSTGQYTCYGPMVKKRMEPFHQLDIRVEKTWKFNDARLSAYLDLINAYNHLTSNIIVPKYDLSGYKSKSVGLPILPSMGLRGEI